MRQLAPLDMVAPGSLGLNLEAQSTILDPHFATQAHNAVRDTAGRLSARHGFQVVTLTPIPGTPDVKTLFQFRKGNGSSEIIVAWDGGIGAGVSDPSGNDISGTVTDADGRWSFHNFNDKAIGFQAGQKPIVWTGTGSFASVVESSGTAPLGGIGTAAFGRVWGVDSDLQTLKYSGLLNETDWDTDGGLIDMRKVWTDGTDSVTGIAAFNGALVVFGNRHIVFWVDGKGNKLGLDPNLLYVADIITGTGCISDLSILAVGDTDLRFLSPHGVQSMQRLISERSTPMVTITDNVRRALINDVSSTAQATIRSAHYANDGIHVISLPNNNKSWVLGPQYADPLTGKQLAVVTTWDLCPTSLLSTEDGILYMGGSWGVAKYAGGTDNGASINFEFNSSWLDFGEEVANVTKLLKRYGAILFAQSSAVINFKWWIDFSEEFKVLQRTLQADGTSEWGTAEYGIAEYSGALSLRQFKLPARGRGQYFRIGISAQVTGTFAIQQTELFSKLGRLA